MPKNYSVPNDAGRVIPTLPRYVPTATQTERGCRNIGTLFGSFGRKLQSFQNVGFPN